MSNVETYQWFRLALTVRSALLAEHMRSMNH